MFPRHDEPRFQVIQLDAHFAAEPQQRPVVDSDRRKAPIGPSGEWNLIRHGRCPSLIARLALTCSNSQACKSRQRYRLYERHFAAVHGSEATGRLKKIGERGRTDESLETSGSVVPSALRRPRMRIALNRAVFLRSRLPFQLTRRFLIWRVFVRCGSPRRVAVFRVRRQAGHALADLGEFLVS